MVSVSVEGIVYAANTNNMQFPAATTRMHATHSAHTRGIHTHSLSSSGRQGSRWKVNHLHEHQASWQRATDSPATCHQLATSLATRRATEPRSHQRRRCWKLVTVCGGHHSETRRKALSLADGRCQTPGRATAAAGRVELSIARMWNYS